MRRPRTPLAIGVVLAAVVSAGLAAAMLPRTPLDGLIDDAAAAVRATFLSRGDAFGDAHVLVLLLDERTLDAEAMRGTPRALMSPVWAEISEKALGGGAEAVAFDFILAFDGGALNVNGERPLKSYDTPFLRLLAREGRAGRLVIGRSKDISPARRFAVTAGTPGVAFVDVSPDSDGVVRRMRLGNTLTNGEIAPTLAGALLRQQSTYGVPVTPPKALNGFPTVSVIDVLECDEAHTLARLFEGKTVLVGTGLPGEDRLRGPDRFMSAPRPARALAPTAQRAGCSFDRPEVDRSGGSVPGVYLHAAAVDAIRSGWALTPLSPAMTGVSAAIAAGLAAIIGLALASTWGAAVGALLIAAAVFAAAAAVQEAGHLASAARPMFAAALGFGCVWAGRLIFLDRRTRVLRSSFSRYVAPEVVDQLLAQERLPALEGERRHISVMFADLSGFTALSEQVDGKTLTMVVNRYLGVIADEVARSGGYVDKFIGDAVMAIWNAPLDLANHERAALEAATAIRDAVAAEAARDEAQGLPNFAIKIGVNSGYAVVGNVGSAERLNYTAVGDVVNVAARLEGLPSVFATPVLIGEATAGAAGEGFALLETASIQVKGRTEPLAVFAPLEEADQAWFDTYLEALALYRNRDFSSAASAWRKLAGEQWNGAGLSAVMAELADDLHADPPGADWRGAVVMRTK